MIVTRDGLDAAKALMELGAKQERERIVAWMRYEYDYHGRTPTESVEDAIERGDHMRERE